VLKSRLNDLLSQKSGLKGLHINVPLKKIPYESDGYVLISFFLCIYFSCCYRSSFYDNSYIYQCHTHLFASICIMGLLCTFFSTYPIMRCSCVHFSALSFIYSLGGYSITHNEFANRKNPLLQQYKIANNECVWVIESSPCHYFLIFFLQCFVHLHNFLYDLSLSLSLFLVKFLFTWCLLDYLPLC
jgi:hypothetical protein